MVLRLFEVLLAAGPVVTNGLFTVTLVNGEVWRQLNGDTTYAHWFKKPESYVATYTTYRQPWVGQSKALHK